MFTANGSTVLQARIVMSYLLKWILMVFPLSSHVSIEMLSREIYLLAAFVEIHKCFLLKKF